MPDKEKERPLKEGDQPNEAFSLSIGLCFDGYRPCMDRQFLVVMRRRLRRSPFRLVQSRISRIKGTSTFLVEH
jgi:hypothetical protein